MISSALAPSSVANNKRVNHKDKLVLDYNDDEYDDGGGGAVTL